MTVYVGTPGVTISDLCEDCWIQWLEVARPGSGVVLSDLCEDCLGRWFQGQIDGAGASLRRMVRGLVRDAARAELDHRRRHGRRRRR